MNLDFGNVTALLGTFVTRGTSAVHREDCARLLPEQEGNPGNLRPDGSVQCRAFPASSAQHIWNPSEVTHVPGVPCAIENSLECFDVLSLPLKYLDEMPVATLLVASSECLRGNVGFGDIGAAQGCTLTPHCVVFDANETRALATAARSGRAHLRQLLDWWHDKAADTQFSLTADIALAGLRAEVDRPHFYNSAWCPNGWSLQRLFDHFELTLRRVLLHPGV